MDNGSPFEIFIAFLLSSPGFALHFVIFVPRASIALVLALSAVLFCDSNYISRSYKNYTFITLMTDIRVTSVIQTYEKRLNSKPYVCSTTFGRATLGASSVSNMLFLSFPFSDPDVGVQFLKDVALIRSSVVCCKCGSSYVLVRPR
jgi:hypothetical protein